MKTSYFANRLAIADPGAVAISCGVPLWFKGRVYDPLRPPWKLVEAVKSGKIMNDEYERRYRAEILAGLNPAIVRRELGDDVILLCWERPGAACHRRIVARWLEEKLGIVVPEAEREVPRAGGRRPADRGDRTTARLPPKRKEDA